MKKLLSKRTADILFGKYDKLEGGTPVMANLNFPVIGSFNKTINWEGNKGLIITLWEKIEKLEKEVGELKTSIIKKK